MSRVYIVGASRTPIGSFGGALSEVSPLELGKATVLSTLSRAEVDPATVEEVVLGNVLGAGHGMNLARQISLGAGLPTTSPAWTVNMVCGSGLRAVALGASQILLGERSAVLAGGVESMSQAAYVSLRTRWGARLGDLELKDLMLLDGLTDAMKGCHMGITAENLASRFGITREEQDDFAYESQQRAKAAIDSGFFREEIAPIRLAKKGGEVVVDRDEHPRPDVPREKLATLKSVFLPNGTVTAGNASGINDGAASVLLMSEEQVRARKLTPLAEIVAWASSGVEPEVMGLGPVEAVRAVLTRAGTTLEQIDVIESNEAFAAQTLAVARSLEWDPSKVNPSGGAIALGHPIGASGTRILVTLLHTMRRTSARLGLATLCVGGGQGVAMVVRAA